ncbi:ADP-ribosylglycohydrolase [Pasteurellaceae bacterium HPA106]|uniref:ADP-ribosylglycohydrolase family protein n=1 Tax=Spirabiliibacterium pneumoniae TaxID=221400 RepID=UPI001AAD742A|nr:ADP-ribosylglycohydrolase family protein [Spirabiliibacterium pneumoniae]MBE2895280.1 ADP-ribosylglycohydrolase [Spirabiliibacterium pneumoniae]
MLGAIVGDIVGSRYEWFNHRSKIFDLFSNECFVTDDSIMTLAIGKALLISRPDYRDLAKNAVKCMQTIGRYYPDCGYGDRFYDWIFSDNPQPYNSFGNGAAMRVSAVGFVAQSLDQAKWLSKQVTAITHNHSEGIKGAEATAVAVFLAKTGYSIAQIREYIDKYYYPMNFTLDEIRGPYLFNETCQETVPQALQTFFESVGFEDAIRNAISIGGDSDTIAAICGGIAQAYYGVPPEIERTALSYLDDRLLALLEEFQHQIDKG